MEEDFNDENSGRPTGIIVILVLWVSLVGGLEYIFFLTILIILLWYFLRFLINENVKFKNEGLVNSTIDEKKDSGKEKNTDEKVLNRVVLKNKPFKKFSPEQLDKQKKMSKRDYWKGRTHNKEIEKGELASLQEELRKGNKKDYGS